MISDSKLLLSAELSRALDSEAQDEWGFNVYSLIEAAGRGCAQALIKAFPDTFAKQPRITVIAGTGNNGADAMVMLRYWLLCGLAEASLSTLIVSRIPKTGETEPWTRIFRSLEKMKVPILPWEGTNEEIGRAREKSLAESSIIVDGIAGTGITGSLRGAALEMVNAVNYLKKRCQGWGSGEQGVSPPPFVVSVDLPSGNSDEWEPGMPIIEADLTLAIEPQKYCIYTPAARPYAGAILPIEGIFPRELIANYKGTELINWDCAREKIPKIRPDAYKNKRGTVEVRAGSPGATGAALIAARGAQAAGAGLIRVVADDDIYPILASQAAGIMVAPASAENAVSGVNNFPPDALVLGPGWGKKMDRTLVLKKALVMEEKGIPLILDADAIELVRDTKFNGNVILTPHPGELCKFTGIDQNELLSRPAPVLLKYARRCNAAILFKGHVITIAAPDGRLGVVDGMTPGLASGGSGDLLAGFCAAIAARMKRENGFDVYDCAAAAAALLIASGKSDGLVNRFTDPLEVANKAADLAGAAWLEPGNYFYG
jgi:NAD(P)H-hydrate epimerase